ncbi:hypothetical protein PPAR_a1522 [Pseudoalteromonas paragorgicola KMM 3548]|nr:hypothetical protein PH505_ah00810 [Pseudoalteromonas distincta]MBE3672248.1 hypothetical protein [Pseudoalteromonas distincta KMM 3548]
MQTADNKASIVDFLIMAIVTGVGIKVCYLLKNILALK